MLTARAYAKVNLTLEVLGKREDGYHQITSVMQTIDLWDEVRFAPSEGLHLNCEITSLQTPDNLVVRAAALLKETTGYAGGAEITLEKGIPLAAGLGGGSSDAAITLRVLNRMWDLRLDIERLLSLAATVGSDVPFFLKGGTALVEGRGEEVHQLPPMPPVCLVLLVPALEIPRKTATLYGHITPDHYADGDATRRMRRSIEARRPPGGDLLCNAFEAVAFDLYPALGACRGALLDAGAGWVRLTGTGPGMYTFAASEAEAKAMAGRLRGLGYRPHVAWSLEPPEWPSLD